MIAKMRASEMQIARPLKCLLMPESSRKVFFGSQLADEVGLARFLLALVVGQKL
jgi:hypothetical protein